MRSNSTRVLILVAGLGLLSGCSESPADLGYQACQAGQQYAQDEIGLEALLEEGEAIGQRAAQADIGRTELEGAMKRECGDLDEAIRGTLLGGRRLTADSLAAEVCLRSRRYQDGGITADAYAKARRDAGARAQLADIPLSDLREAVTSQCGSVTVSAVLDAAEKRAGDDQAGAIESDESDGAQDRSKDTAPSQEPSEDEAAPTTSGDGGSDESGVAKSRLYSCPAIEPESDFRVDAVGVYEGGGTASVRQEDSSRLAGRVDVVVNRPDKPVVLVLSAYEPVIWSVEAKPATQLAGIIVSGYYTQKVKGVDEAVPVRATSYKGPGNCDEAFHAYELGSEFLKANDIVVNLLGHEIDTFNGTYRAERFVIGKPSPDIAAVRERAEEATKPAADLRSVKAGEAGIEQLRRRGALRPARAAELERWAELVRQAQDLSKRELPAPEHKRVRPVYTVTEAIRYPKDLHGAHSQRFLIPEGVPEPRGDPGHSTVYDMNTASCRGTGCPKLVP